MRADQSAPMGWRLIQRDSDGGRVFRIEGAPKPIRKSEIRTPDRLTPDQIKSIHRACMQAMTPERLESLSAELSLPSGVLKDLRVGWSRGRQAYTFPMRNAAGEIIGFRTRHADGAKRCINGSRNGLFMRHPRQREVLYVAEGPTDAATLWAMGFDAIGRPQALGCEEMLVDALRRRHPRLVVIFPDRDGPRQRWVGQRGAVSLGTALTKHGIESAIVLPPAKDLRAWWIAGARRDDMLRLLKSVIGQGRRSDPVTAQTNKTGGSTGLI